MCFIKFFCHFDETPSVAPMSCGVFELNELKPGKTALYTIPVVKTSYKRYVWSYLDCTFESHPTWPTPTKFHGSWTAALSILLAIYGFVTKLVYCSESVET